MNDSPVDIGIVNNLGNPVTPILGEAIPITGIVAFLDHKWNEQVHAARSATRAGHRQHRGPGAERVQDRPVRARQPALLPGAERDGRRRVPVGPARELLGRVPERRRQGAVLVQVQLLVQAWRLVMNRRHRWHRSPAARCAASPLALSHVGARAPRRRRTSQKAVDAAYAKFRDAQGRQERRLHSGARQGRSEPVRHRAGDRRTARSTPPATSRPRSRFSRSPRSSRWRR